MSRCSHCGSTLAEHIQILPALSEDNLISRPWNLFDPLLHDVSCRLHLVRGRAFTVMLHSAVVDRGDGLYELKKACNECNDADSDVERLEILRR